MPYKSDAKEYKLQRLNEIQKNAASLLIQGHTNKEVAEKLGIAEITVCKYKNSTLFQTYLLGLRNKVEDMVVSNEKLVGEIVPKALHLNLQLIDKALNEEIENKDAIQLAKHWTKPFVDLPTGNGSMLSPEDIQTFTKKAQEIFFNRGRLDDDELIPVEITPYREAE